MTSPTNFLTSDDPLSRVAAAFLVGYREEDNRVDYKLTFDIDSDRSWLELTKDASSLANTFGGYLVFGVADGTKKVAGISKEVADRLKDSNNILQKVNRHLEPDITALRSKIYRFEGKSVGFIYVPQSIGQTHIISKDGSFNHPSGKAKTILRKGTFYVRRSGSNHLADSRDIDDLVEGRIDQFRSSLLDKIARVVETPATSEVFVLSKDKDDPEGKRFVIEDSPDSVSIKGMSFTVAPQGPQEEIAGWTTLCAGDSSKSPPPAIIWKWYAQRESIELRKAHKLALMQFSLWNEAPAFFWIAGLKNADIRRSLLEAIRQRCPGVSTTEMLVLASFLGKTPYKSAVGAFGKDVHKIPPAMRVYPTVGAVARYKTIKPMPKQTLAQLRKEKLAEINDIASATMKSGKQPALQKRWKALPVDCFLYAQDDRYT